MFNRSIAIDNLQEAIALQNAIYEKIGNNELSPSLINQLEIPVKIENASLLNKESMLKYLMNEVEVYETFTALQELSELLPTDGEIKYNLCAIKFNLWIISAQAIETKAFKKEILQLSNYGIPSNLVKRMMINYHILMSEYSMLTSDFAQKDKSLKYIYSNYKYSSLSDDDYLSLAQYFASYTKYDWAKKVIVKKAKSINADEELLFYYLNLTIGDNKQTKKSEYRTIMLNALNKNQERFCNFFLPYNEGGISFQLLEDKFIRDTYCENCNK